MQDSFACARTRPSARATIGYLVYKVETHATLVHSPMTRSVARLVMVSHRACLITLHSNFEIFQKGHPAVEFMIDRRIFER